jgi:hypothetical protein
MYDKKHALTFFDGTMQSTYQWHKRGWEMVYCHHEPTPFECACCTMDPKAKIYNFDLKDPPKSSFCVETSKTDDGKMILCLLQGGYSQGIFYHARTSGKLPHGYFKKFGGPEKELGCQQWSKLLRLKIF